MQVSLIQVPYMAGDDRPGAAKGPQRLAKAAQELLAAKGIAVTMERVTRGHAFRDSASASLVVCADLARIVRNVMVAGQFPIVLAGSCDTSKGVLSGFDHGRCGVVWIDAHGDFNTPETTISGFFPGMSLAVITGACYGSYWAQIGNSAPIEEATTLLIGVRDLDPEERRRLERSGIQVVAWHEGRPQGNVVASVDVLAKRVREVYLHVDMDSLDPGVAPGVADHPVEGGLSLQDMEQAIRTIASRLEIRAATLATYDPDRDLGERTLHVGLRIIELLTDGGGRLPSRSAA